MAFFRNKRSLISLLTTFVGMLAIFYLDPTLSIRLEEFGVSENNVGYYFAIEGFAFGVGSPITGWLCSKFDRRTIIQFCLFQMGIALFFVGPSELLHFPQTLGFITFGLIALGFGVAGAFVPLIPEIVEAV